MAVVSLSGVTKSFGRVKAVECVSFAVEEGEIFGLLGPNGAGKTTIIRLILNILKPDAGEILVFGESFAESMKSRIGYLPEERGLYQDSSLERVLVYLARLKGVPTSEARNRMLDFLERMDLLDCRKKKIQELSKGMQQKAQIIAALLHHPQLVIVDEPFSALDPINTQMIKSLLKDLRLQGKSIILSTHQLNHAEELCDRILLINQGRRILYGALTEVLHDYSDHAILVRPSGELPDIPGIKSMQKHNQSYRLELEEMTNPQEVLSYLISRNVSLEQFEIATPTLEEIFIKAVTKDG